MPQRWAVICKQCHGTAFVVLGDLPGPSEVVTARRCEHLDGRPLVATEMTCDSCGADFAQTGVEPSSAWRLLAESLVSAPHNPNDAPFGTAADPRDIASVRLAIASATRPPTPVRARRASPKRSTTKASTEVKP
jgi:hypothetical protein